MKNLIRPICNIFKKLDCSVLVNAVSITKLGPCKDRLDNFNKFYSARSFTPRQFMGLKNITHDDKVWVAFRLMSPDNIGKAAGEVTKTVLHIYESEYPTDNRPRVAVEAAISGTVTPKIITDAEQAHVYAHASDAYIAAAYVASAAYATCISSAAVNSAIYAANAAHAAHTAINAAGTEQLAQEKRIRTIILRYWK